MREGDQADQINCAGIEANSSHSSAADNNTSGNGTLATATVSSVSNVGSTRPPTSKNAILVNPRQRGNPVLKFIRNVPWEYAEVVPDYVIGQTTCALFLSIRYHNLHPDYIHERLKEVKHSYILRVLLVQIDVSDPFPILKSLTHISMLADLTIIPANSAEEAGKILENYKIYENKPADFIQEKQDPNILQQVIDSLTSIRVVNKTDAMILLHNFGSLEEIMKARVEKLALCPGFGPHKAQKLFDALHENFKSKC